MSRDHDESAPPSPPSRGRATSLPDAEPTLEEVYRLARYTARQVGRPPNPLAGEEPERGTMWHAIATTQGQIAEVREQLVKLEGTAEKILAKLAEGDARRGWLSTRGEKLLDAALVALLLAILAVLLARLGLPSKAGDSGGAYQGAGLIAQFSRGHLQPGRRALSAPGRSTRAK